MTHFLGSVSLSVAVLARTHRYYACRSHPVDLRCSQTLRQRRNWGYCVRHDFCPVFRKFPTLNIDIYFNVTFFVYVHVLFTVSGPSSITIPLYYSALERASKIYVPLLVQRSGPHILSTRFSIGKNIVLCSTRNVGSWCSTKKVTSIISTFLDQIIGHFQRITGLWLKPSHHLPSLSGACLSWTVPSTSRTLPQVLFRSEFIKQEVSTVSQTRKTTLWQEVLLWRKICLLSICLIWT